MTATIPNRILSLCAALLCLTVGAFEARATHDSNEKYDGTVDSIQWLKRPISVSHVSFRDSEGNNVRIADFKGRFVLLNFWSTTCGPCLAELPALDRLNLRLGGDDFVTLPVSVDDNLEEAQQFFSGRLVLRSLDFYRESRKQIGKDFPMDVLPASFIIDREGNAIGLIRSNIAWDGPRADPMFKKLFAGASTGSIQADIDKAAQQAQ